jgi:hypothetical protein
MWETQPLATLRASTACYRDNFTFTSLGDVIDEINLDYRKKEFFSRHIISNQFV